LAQTIEGGASERASDEIFGPREPVVTPDPLVQPPPISRTAKSQARRTRVVVRRVGPVSVLKFSLIFYFCVMLILFLGLLLLYAIMTAIGVTKALETSLGSLFATDNFRINGKWVFERVFLVGCALVVVWSLINVMVTFLYNLISDLVGGIEITLAEKR
jgi:hypothetical protein